MLSDGLELLIIVDVEVGDGDGDGGGREERAEDVHDERGGS